MCLGPVWIKVERTDEYRGTRHRLSDRWGSWEALYSQVLNGPIYFTLEKRDLSSPRQQ